MCGLPDVAFAGGLRPSAPRQVIFAHVGLVSPRRALGIVAVNCVFFGIPELVGANRRVDSWELRAPLLVFFLLKSLRGARRKAKTGKNRGRERAAALRTGRAGRRRLGNRESF